MTFGFSFLIWLLLNSCSDLYWIALVSQEKISCQRQKNESDRESMNEKERRKKTKKLIKAIFEQQKSYIPDPEFQKSCLESYLYQQKTLWVYEFVGRIVSFFSPDRRRHRRRKLYSILGIGDSRANGDSTSKVND